MFLNIYLQHGHTICKCYTNLKVLIIYNFIPHYYVWKQNFTTKRENGNSEYIQVTVFVVVNMNL